MKPFQRNIDIDTGNAVCARVDNHNSSAIQYPYSPRHRMYFVQGMLQRWFTLDINLTAQNQR